MRSGGAGSGTSDPRIGANRPVSARWGDCTKDWPRENIVSPYAFATAAEHYAALKADARKRGGPTKHTHETMPKWDGVYGEYLPEGRRVWNYGRATQVPTFLSILTPEYQQRMVRQLYHEGVDAAHQWSASYCWPEGFMRQWATGPKPQRIVVTPEVVMFVGSGSGNIVRVAHVDRELPLGQDIPQWYGDTVAFWDGDALIMHTANVQSLDAAHDVGVQLRVRDGRDLDTRARRGGQVPRRRLGDRHLRRRGACRARAHPLASQLSAELERGRAGSVGPSARVRCTRSTASRRKWRPAKPSSSKCPDMFDRPWAKIWEEHFEQDMERPSEEIDLGFK